MLIHTLSLLIIPKSKATECSDTNFQLNDVNLTPGMFFPNNKNVQPISLQNSTVYQPFSSAAVQSQPIQNAQSSNSGNSMPYLPSQYYSPNNTLPNSISASMMQPPNGNMLANQCDNSLERDKFKQCLANALKSLRSILENCKKNLGENAKECCINDECLDSLKGNTSEKNDAKKNNEFASTEFLERFLQFLQDKLSKTNSFKTRYPSRREREQSSEITDRYDEIDYRSRRPSHRKRDIRDEFDGRRYDRYREDDGFDDREDRRAYSPRRSHKNDQAFDDYYKKTDRGYRDEERRNKCRDPCEPSENDRCTDPFD